MQKRKSHEEKNIENQVINPNNCELQQCLIVAEKNEKESTQEDYGAATIKIFK